MTTDGLPFVNGRGYLPLDFLSSLNDVEYQSNTPYACALAVADQLSII